MCSPCVVGSFLIHVTNMDVVFVRFELVGRQYPASLAPVSQSRGPPRWPYYLVGPPLRRDASEDPAHLQDLRICGVAFDGLTVYPPHISGSAVIVGIGQATGLAIALGDERTVWDAR